MSGTTSYYARCRRRFHSGFTLIEAMIALSVAVVAGSALLLGVATSLEMTESSLEETIALGIAEQLVDEVFGKLYVTPGGDPYQFPLSPSPAEMAGPGRSLYNDIDDFHGFVASPPEDIWGHKLGEDDGQGNDRHPEFFISEGFLNDWLQEIEVYYVDQYDPAVRLPAGQTSPMRAVHVRIYKVDPNGVKRELSSVRRVGSFVPTL